MSGSQPILTFSGTYGVPLVFTLGQSSSLQSPSQQSQTPYSNNYYNTGVNTYSPPTSSYSATSFSSNASPPPPMSCPACQGTNYNQQSQQGQCQQQGQGQQQGECPGCKRCPSPNYSCKLVPNYESTNQYSQADDYSSDVYSSYFSSI
jgi:hypothetical protein